MARSTHTPGPWLQFDDGGHTESGLNYGSAYADCVWRPEGPGHGLIADCSPNSQAPTIETVANARLIAAAPDMLAALRLARGSLIGVITEEERTETINAIRAAIAKAEGRA